MVKSCLPQLVVQKINIADVKMIPVSRIVLYIFSVVIRGLESSMGPVANNT